MQDICYITQKFIQQELVKLGLIKWTCEMKYYVKINIWLEFGDIGQKRCQHWRLRCTVCVWLGVWVKENISCSLVNSGKEVVSHQSKHGWHWVKGKNNTNTHVCHCSSIRFVLIFIVFDYIVWCDSLYKIIYILQLKILLYLWRFIPLFVDLCGRC